MIKEFFHTTVYTPLYNALVGLLSLSDWIDVGIAIIILTVIVKTILFPLSLKAARTQVILKKIEKPLKEIREKYKDNREEQGKKMIELYREHNVNPFSSFLVLFIQLPIILGLYFVFLRGGLPDIDPTLLYGFVTVPENVSMLFFGFVDMAGKNIPLAILAGVTQHIQARLAMPSSGPRQENATFQEDFARSLQTQVKYVLPFVIMFVAYIATAAVALYWITSNIFAIGQEIYVKKKIKTEEVEKE